MESEPVLARYGDWHVTPTAVVHTPSGENYALTVANLTSPLMDWDRHMADKRWCVVGDFQAARDHLLALHTERRAA